MSRSITLIIGGLRGGGAEKVCVTLANGLVEQGYSVDLVVLSLNGAVREKELSPQVNLINLNVKHTRHSSFAIYRYLKQAKPQMVLSFNRQISVVLGIIRSVMRLDFTLISRNIIFLSIAEAKKKGLWHGFIVKNLIKKFYSLSDYFIAQSSAMKVDLVDYLGVEASRVEVINNPVCQIIASHQMQISLGEAAIETAIEDYLLCVGRLEEQKAFHYAIEAFSKVAPKYPELRLKIVGQGSLEIDLKKCAAKFNVSERVDFEGFQEKMIPYYANAKATLLTSLFEGFPNVLVESITLGTPVVSFDCPSGPSEIIEDGVNGYLVGYQDVDALADKVSLVCEGSIIRSETQKTSDRYTIEKILQSYQSLIETKT
nr:glycosyltransferase [uncultured Vibrio sp.]